MAFRPFAVVLFALLLALPSGLAGGTTRADPARDGETTVPPGPGVRCHAARTDIVRMSAASAEGMLELRIEVLDAADRAFACGDRAMPETAATGASSFFQFWTTSDGGAPTLFSAYYPDDAAYGTRGTSLHFPDRDTAWAVGDIGMEGNALVYRIPLQGVVATGDHPEGRAYDFRGSLLGWNAVGVTSWHAANSNAFSVGVVDEAAGGAFTP